MQVGLELSTKLMISAKIGAQSVSTAMPGPINTFDVSFLTGSDFPAEK